MSLTIDTVKYADLDGKFIVLQNVSASGNMYAEHGVGYLLFGITGNNVYRITYDEATDPTKGELVVTGDPDNSQVIWAQDHDVHDSYRNAQDGVYPGYARSKYYGDDLGYPLLAALHEHITGTYNIVDYDTNLVGLADLLSALEANGSASDVPAPTSVAATATADGATITAK